MKILDKRMTLDELRSIASDTFGDMVKAVVDVDRRLVALDAELHSDLEALFLDNGSRQQDLWGINLYPLMAGDDFLEFDSMINMRPSQGNMSRGVEDRALRQTITGIVEEWISE
ncbi:MAG: DUF5674 family protein [Candidatus Krumholzibacteria bacterium]|jgi:hypothetical protein|nr:DUF5674 family protein [Candidatus Krumholzibacteria bacterium]